MKIPLLLTLSAALALAACKPAPGPSATPTSSTPIRVGAAYWPGFYWMDVAQEKGWFKEAGLNVEWVDTNADYFASFDDLVSGKEAPIDVSKVAVSMNGIELQDREFISAIREGREPNSSVAQVLPCYHVLDALEKQL